MADFLDEVLDSELDNQAEKFNQSMFTANQSNPDQYAKVLELAKKRNLNPQFVENNYNALAPLNEDYSGYHDLQSRAPISAEWLSNPENAKVAKDDIANLAGLESVVYGSTRWGDVYNLIVGGTIQMAENLAKSPALIFNDSGIFGDDYYKPSDYQPKSKQAYEQLYKNPVTNYLSKAAEPYDVKRDRTDIWKNAANGNLWPLAYGSIHTAPNLLLLLVPEIGLPVLGMGAAAEKNAQLLQKGVKPETAAMSAAATGAFEVLTEQLGGIAEGGKSFKALIKEGVAEMGEAGFKATFTKAMKNILKTGKEEFGEEYLNEWASGIVDWGLGVSDLTPDQLSMNAIESGLVGFASGVGLSAGGHAIARGIDIVAHNEDLKSRMQTAYGADLWTNIGGYLDQGKLNKRSADKSKDFLDKTLNGSGAENSYIPTSDFDEYYQSKKIDPVDAAKSLGISREYEQAKETGTDIKLNSANLMVETKKSGDYDAIRDISRMSEDGLSVKELKAQQEQQAKEQKELKKFVDEQLKLNEKSGDAVIEDVVKQLVDTGMPKRQAREQAIIYRFFQVQAEKVGTTAEELYKRYGMKVIKPKPNIGGIVQNIPEDLMAQPVLTRNEFGEYDYRDEDLKTMLAGLKRGAAPVESYNPITKKKYNTGSTFPSWFKNQGEKSQKVTEVLTKQINGEKLTKVEKEILAKMYENYQDSLGRGELFQSGNKPEMFSQLIKTVESKIPNNATPSQILATLKDLKPEEIEWSGIKSFLDRKEKVNKAELVEYLKANQLNVQDVTLGSKGKPKKIDKQQAIDYINAGWNVFYYYEDEGDFSQRAITIDEITIAPDDAMFGVGETEYIDDTKYSKYTLPSGENYREVLFTLPESKPHKPNYEVKYDSKSGYYQVKNGDVVVGSFTSSTAANAAIEEYDNLYEKYGTVRGDETAKQSYRSSHFSQPNILAHTRLTDRTDTDGKKVLFVEEIQSDWHQAGRKKGYKLNPKREAELKAKIKEIEAIGKEATPEQKDEWVAAMNELQPQKATSSVPNAPFKKTWHEFAFKKILMMAVDGGYDKVAWTTGEQQAERFDLSKQIGAIEATKNKDATYDVSAFKDDAALGRNRNPLIEKKSVTAEELSDLIGKDLAEKITKDVGYYETKKYSGLDLKVGGEGMKGFYDKILVDYANKVGKKFGAKAKDIYLQNDNQLLANDNAASAAAIGAAPVHALEVTSDMAKSIAESGLPLFQNNQGSYNRQTRVISLFKSSDRSTFLHESAHFFFDVLADLSKTSPKVKTDFDKILSWVGAENAESVTREQHEKFSRGFEAYLLEGKAPTRLLQKAFNTFKVWLTGIYRNYAGLERQAGQSLGLTDEIRQVMDRMLATEEEINAAEEVAAFKPLMLDETKDKLEDARISAEARLNRKLLESAERKKNSDYKTETARAQLQKLPIYNAISVLRTGSTIAGQVVGNVKINADTIKEKYGEDMLKSMPRGTVAPASNEYALPVDVVAEMMGYADADVFLSEITTVEPLDQAARKQANQIIKREYPDLLESAEIKQEAMSALHNEKRGTLLKYEYEHLFNKARGEFNTLARRMISRMPIEMVVKEQAARYVDKLKASELKPYLYLRAERQHSRDAARLFTAGDFKGALESKRKEYLNFEIYREVTKAKENVDKFSKWSKRVFEKKEDLAKKRDIDLVNAARLVLSKYGIGPQIAEQIELDLNNLKEYNESSYNNISSMIADVLTRATPNVDDTMYDNFKSMADTVKILWDMSKDNKTAELDGKRELVEDIVKQISDVVITLTTDKKSKKQYDEASSKFDEFKTDALDYFASRTRINQWANTMDLGVRGVFRKLFVEKTEDASAKFRLEHRDVVAKLEAIFKKYEDIFTLDKIVFSGIANVDTNQEFRFQDKTELLMMLLNIGNESNKFKLLAGYKWGGLNEQGVLDDAKFDEAVEGLISKGILTVKDFQFLTDIWALNESLKPAAQKAHKYTQGFYFDEITAKPFTNSLGTWAGGYVPARYDKGKNVDAKAREERRQIEESDITRQFPMPNKGFSKKRVSNYAAPLDLDITNLQSHLVDVLKFSNFEPAVADIRKVVLNKKFSAIMNDFNSGLISRVIIPNLQTISTQRTTKYDNHTFKMLNSFASYLRGTSSMMVMANNVTNFFQDHFSAMAALTKVKSKHLGSALVSYLTDHNKSIDLIRSEPFMASINDDNTRDLIHSINQIAGDSNYFKDFRHFTQKQGAFLQEFSSAYIKNIVWLGSYNQSISSGMDDASARREANLTVKITQHTQLPEVVSSSETGTPLYMLMNQFAGFFNNIYNLNESEYTIAYRKMGLKKALPRMMYVYGMSVMAVAISGQLIANLMRGDGFDDDGDGDTDINDILSLFFTSQFKFLTASFPIVGPTVNTIANRYNHKFYDDKLQVMPSMAVLESAAGAAYSLTPFIDREFKKKDIKDVLNLLGLMTGLPTTMLSKPAGYLFDVNSGKANPSGPIDFTRGLLSGQSGTK